MYNFAVLRCPPSARRHLSALLLAVCSFGFVQSLRGQPEDVGQFIKELQDRSWVVRLDAAFALGKLRNPAIVEPLIASLRDVDADVRRTAATALGEIGDRRAVEPLLTVLRDNEPQVRACAVTALGKIGDLSAIPSLIPVLEDEDPNVRGSVADSLAFFKDPRTVEPLIRALKDAETAVRLSAARALDDMKDPRADQPLVEALQQKNDPVVGGAYKFFIGQGMAGSEAELISALNLFGNKQMALDFLNCGNPQLAEAGRAWARTYGYMIVADPNSLVTNPVVWGSERLAA